MGFKGPLPDHILNKIDQRERKSMGKAGETIKEATERENIKLERELQSQIAQYLQMRGITPIIPPMNKRSQLPKSWPDVTFVYRKSLTSPARPILIEAKGPKTVVTKEQEAMHVQLRSQGWEVYVVRSLEEVRQILS